MRIARSTNFTGYRLIRPLPRVADIGVKRNRHHDRGPGRRKSPASARHGLAARIVRTLVARPEVRHARHLIAIVQSRKRCERSDRRPGCPRSARSGKTIFMRFSNISHSRAPWKSSAMKKPPRSRYSRSALRLLVGEPPLAHLHRVEPGPIVLVAFVQIDGLLHGPHMDAGESLAPPARNAGRRADNPGSRARAPVPVAIEAAAIAVVRARRKHQAGERKLGLLLPVRWKVETEVLDCREIAGRAAGRHTAHPSESPRIPVAQDLPESRRSRLHPRCIRVLHPGMR